jgi:hypothetical protein
MSGGYSCYTALMNEWLSNLVYRPSLYSKRRFQPLMSTAHSLGLTLDV